MGIFEEVLTTIQQVVTMLKDFFENILATLKGEDNNTDEGAEA